MKLKKRKKRSRIRGSRTFGYGFRKQHKGHGNKGGFGMAGTGKRAKHKKLKALLIAREAGFESYFGKRGYTSAPRKKKKEKVINLEDVAKNYGKEGKINVEKYKILGKGEGFKAEIIAKAASKSAIEKIEKAGGKIIIKNKENN